MNASKAAATTLLVTDMDDTLLGDAVALEDFGIWLARHPEVRYAVATGRDAVSAWAELKRWRASLPDVLISRVGAEIHWARSRLPQRRHTHWIDFSRPDAIWAEQLSAQWQRDACAAALSNWPMLTLQPAAEQSRNKLSYCTDAGPVIVPLVEQQLMQAELAARVVYSHGRFVDLLAPGGAKGGAAEYVARRLRIPFTRIMGAGNSGNDADLLQSAACGIAVANCEPELRALASLPTVYFAQQRHAAGLVEGLGYWLARSSHESQAAPDANKCAQARL